MEGNWMQPSNINSGVKNSIQNLPFPSIGKMAPFMHTWKNQIKDQERVVANKHQSNLDPTRQVSDYSEPNTTCASDGTMILDYLTAHNVVTDTQNIHSTTEITNTWNDTLNNIEVQWKLNEKQLVAFQIAANRFQTILVESKTGLVKSRPLQMLLTGPGGTGKTHVVNALKELMKMYHCGHRIRFLAPTGGAAGLIGGQTIHTGCRIKIHTKGIDNSDKYGKDLNVEIPFRKREELRAEWKYVDFLLIDEVSMLSAELLCELDAVLHYA
jgi:PIF1-like helicase